MKEKNKALFKEYYNDETMPAIELEDKVLDLFDVVEQSEQLVCDCGDSNMTTWYGNDDDKKWFCFNCKKEAN